MSDYRKQEASEARRRLAWDLLKQTRNPEYVALRYGYPIETMRQALAKIPKDADGPYVRSPAAARCHSILQRASDFIPQSLRGARVPEREPGCDDDLGE